MTLNTIPTTEGHYLGQPVWHIKFYYDQRDKDWKYQQKDKHLASECPGCKSDDNKSRNGYRNAVYPTVDSKVIDYDKHADSIDGTIYFDREAMSKYHIESTPRNGYHVFVKANGIKGTEGVDVLGTGKLCAIAGTHGNLTNKGYNVVNDIGEYVPLDESLVTWPSSKSHKSAVHKIATQLGMTQPKQAKRVYADNSHNGWVNCLKCSIGYGYASKQAPSIVFGSRSDYLAHVFAASHKHVEVADLRFLDKAALWVLEQYSSVSCADHVDHKCTDADWAFEEAKRLSELTGMLLDLPENQAIKTLPKLLPGSRHFYTDLSAQLVSGYQKSGKSTVAALLWIADWVENVSPNVVVISTDEQLEVQNALTEDAYVMSAKRAFTTDATETISKALYEAPRYAPVWDATKPVLLVIDVITSITGSVKGDNYRAVYREVQKAMSAHDNVQLLGIAHTSEAKADSKMASGHGSAAYGALGRVLANVEKVSSIDDVSLTVKIHFGGNRMAERSEQYLLTMTDGVFTTIEQQPLDAQTPLDIAHGELLKEHVTDAVYFKDDLERLGWELIEVSDQLYTTRRAHDLFGNGKGQIIAPNTIGIEIDEEVDNILGDMK